MVRGVEMGEACVCGEKTRGKRCEQRRSCFRTAGIVQAEKGQIGRQQRGMFASGKDEWNERDLERSGEERDRRDENRV